MAEPWTAEDLDWAHECAAAGDSFAEIGAAFGLSAQEVADRLQAPRPPEPCGWRSGYLLRRSPIAWVFSR